MNPLVEFIKSYYTKKRLLAIFLAVCCVSVFHPLFDEDTVVIYFLLFIFFVPVLENEIYKRL